MSVHLEVLVEGISDKKAVGILIKKIIGKNPRSHTWTIIYHQGLGDMPCDFDAKINPKNRTLLHQLPKKLRGYEDEKKNNLAIVVLVDGDKKDCTEFKSDLLKISKHCCPSTKIIFRIAIEELEAWFFGDQEALKKAYPKANQKQLNSYVQDTQDMKDGTWEFLAGVIGIKRRRISKTEWAENICPYMDVENNKSPSFRVFRDGIRDMIEKYDKPPSNRPNA